MLKRHNIYSAVIFLHIIILSSYVFAAEPFIIDNDFYRHSIGKHVKYFEDKENKLSLNDVINVPAQWKAWNQDIINFGYSASTYWFSVTIDNRQKTIHEIYFEIDKSIPRFG